MDFLTLFKEFLDRKRELRRQEEILREDYRLFISRNRELIKKHLPKNGEIVKYDRSEARWNDEEWIYLRITDNRLVSQHTYGNYIPDIGAIPLDKDFNELRSFNERIPINCFSKIEKRETDKINTIGFVYLIKIEETNIYKIGFSSDPSSRISSIRTSSPMDIEIVSIFKCYDARKIEKGLHELFKTKNKNREWFDLSEEDIEALNGFIGDHLIQRFYNLNDINLVKVEDSLNMDSYEREKDDLKQQFEILKRKYIDHNSVVAIGGRITNHGGTNYIIKAINLNDKIDELENSLYISYGGFKILKSGKLSNEYNQYILLDRDKVPAKKTSFSTQAYLEEKKKLLTEFETMKKSFFRENCDIKRGDIVVDVYGDQYQIELAKFNDLLEWKNKGYFTFGGYKILKSGKLSKKYQNLFNIQRKDRV